MADIQWNEYPIRAMTHVVEADWVFSQEPDMWRQKEDDFYREMLAGLAAEGYEL